MGYLLKRTKILYPTDNKIKDSFLLVGTLIGAVMFVLLSNEPPRLIYFKNTVAYGNPFQIYCCAALFVIAILLVCKFINHIPYVSWLGRYSIIILVTHLLISAFTVRVISTVIPSASTLIHDIVNYVLIIGLMSMVIPFCKKYLPYITAQKDLLQVKGK
jgi:fucose 4-O-acetylase-like acetyltransferase